MTFAFRNIMSYWEWRDINRIYENNSFYSLPRSEGRTRGPDAPGEREERRKTQLYVEKWTRGSVSVSSDTILVKACAKTRHTMMAPQEDTREQRATQ